MVLTGRVGGKFPATEVGGRCSSGDNDGGLHEVMATYSFYDHRLDLWELTI